MPASKPILVLIVAAYYAAHQDLWLWNRVHPLVFGFLPAGLAYHAAYTLGAVALMAMLVRLAWPHHLEKDPGGEP